MANTVSLFRAVNTNSVMLYQYFLFFFIFQDYDTRNFRYDRRNRKNIIVGQVRVMRSPVGTMDEK